MHSNPITKAPFYIGKGTANRALAINGRSEQWFDVYKILKNEGLIFECKILHICNSQKKALSLESKEIAKAVDEGHDLVNKHHVIELKKPSKGDAKLEKLVELLVKRELKKLQIKEDIVPNPNTQYKIGKNKRDAKMKDIVARFENNKRHGLISIVEGVGKTPITKATLLKLSGIRKTTFLKQFNKLVSTGFLIRSGLGSKNVPFTYTKGQA